MPDGPLTPELTRPSVWGRATTALSIVLGTTCAVGLAIAVRDYTTEVATAASA